MITVPHLETDITQACQLSCVACNHAVPLWRKHGPWFARASQVEKDLAHLSTLVHTPAWGALGGEPLLHRDLPGILSVVRSSGIADSLSVWTNGLLVRKQSEDFWRSFDELVVSIYPGKLTDEDLTWIAAACADHGVRFTPRDERATPNFMTFLEPKPTSAPVTAKKYRDCEFRRGHNYAASYGFFFMCCCGPHIPMLVQGREFGEDGIRIEGLTPEALEAYLSRIEPLGACSSCAGRGTSSKWIPWSEERNPVIWMRASAGVNE